MFSSKARTKSINMVITVLEPLLYWTYFDLSCQHCEYDIKCICCYKTVLIFQVGGYLSEPYILVDIPIGKDSFVDYKHKQCACTSEGCVDSKHAMTLTILLEYGTYNGMPASKVLMIPYTGIQFIPCFYPCWVYVCIFCCL